MVGKCIAPARLAHLAPTLQDCCSGLLGLPRPLIRTLEGTLAKSYKEQTEEALSEMRHGSREDDGPQSAKRCHALLHRCQRALELHR
jgi:hypothetical protein